jgi:hypothetical protein
MRLSTSSPIKIRSCRSWPSFFTSIYRRSNRNEENSVNENESRSRESENHSYRFDGVTGLSYVCQRRRRTRFTSQRPLQHHSAAGWTTAHCDYRRLRRVSFRVDRHCVQRQADDLATNGRARTIADGNYPFEFSLPISPSTDAVDIRPRLRKKVDSGAKPSPRGATNETFESKF